MKLQFEGMRANSTSELVFENQFPLALRIGGIILLSIGLSASELGNFRELYKHRITRNFPKQGQTRLCTKPWEAHALGLLGEVVPCPRFPLVWNIGNTEGLSTGIDGLRNSLLKGVRNQICVNCRSMPAAPIQQLKEVLDRRSHPSREDTLEELLSRQKASSRPPLPPPHLRFRISGSSDDNSFLNLGLVGSSQMMSLVEKYDKSARPSLLDWGCGCGRFAPFITTRWPHVSYTGCDIDSEAIAWCNEHLPNGRFVATDPYPPTPFDVESFSAVIASSVMTHLSEQNQKLWLTEIHRVLKPGGIFIASVLGLTAALQMPGLVETLPKEGFVDSHDGQALNGIAPEGYYRDVYQTENYTRQKWTELFEIREYIPAGLTNFQDLVVLQKKEMTGWVDIADDLPW